MVKKKKTALRQQERLPQRLFWQAIQEITEDQESGMRLVKMSVADRFFMKGCDLFRLFYGKKAIVESYLYPKQISDRLDRDVFVETGINNTMLKSSYDKNWYTIDPQSRRGLLKADKELADLLDDIDYRKRQMSQTTRYLF